MYTVLVIVQVLVAVALIGMILLQQGKGADAGAAFGSGASGTVFGSRGSANFLSRTTAWLAAVFFASSLALTYLVHGHVAATGSVVDRLAAPVPAPVVPAIPGLPTGGPSTGLPLTGVPAPAPALAPTAAQPIIPPEAGTADKSKGPQAPAPAPAKIPE